MALILCFLLFVGGRFNLPCINVSKDYCMEELVDGMENDLSPLDMEVMSDNAVDVFFYKLSNSGFINIIDCYTCTNYATVVCPPPDITI